MVAPIVAGAARVAVGTARKPGLSSPRPVRPTLRPRPEGQAARLRSYGAPKGQGQTQSEVSGGSKRRIGTMTAFFLIATALFIDGAQALVNLIPIIGQIASTAIALFAGVLFALWFFMLRINYLSGRRVGIKLVSSAGAFFGEILPIVGAFPLMTAGVVGIIIATNLEDREQPVS